MFLKYFYSSAAIMSKCLVFQYGYSVPVCVVLLHRKFQLWVCRKGTTLALLEREGVLIQGSLCSPLKSGGFGGTFGCTGKGYVGRETSLASLEREESTLQGSLCSPLKSGGFLWHFCVHR